MWTKDVPISSGISSGYTRIAVAVATVLLARCVLSDWQGGGCSLLVMRAETGNDEDLIASSLLYRSLGLCRWCKCKQSKICAPLAEICTTVVFTAEVKTVINIGGTRMHLPPVHTKGYSELHCIYKTTSTAADECYMDTVGHISI